MATESGSILNTSTLRRLEQLQLAVRARSRSSLKGERRSRARGHSVEFADHRNYSSGDDLRYLDWNLYGRLDRLFVKLYEEEREVPVQLYLDSSESMKFGDPSKFECARAIAAAIGYLTLHGDDRLGFTAGPSSAVPAASRHFLQSIRGRGFGLRFLQNLELIRPGGAASANDWMKSLLHASGPRGVAIAISDFLEEDAFLQTMKKVSGAGYQLVFIQVLSPQEINPPFQGELKVVDAESGQSREITFGRFRLRAYQQMVEGFRKHIEDQCRKCGARHIFINSDSSPDQILFKTLREQAVIA